MHKFVRHYYIRMILNPLYTYVCVRTHNIHNTHTQHTCATHTHPHAQGSSSAGSSSEAQDRAQANTLLSSAAASLQRIPTAYISRGKGGSNRQQLAHWPYRHSSAGVSLTTDYTNLTKLICGTRLDYTSTKPLTKHSELPPF